MADAKPNKIACNIKAIREFHGISQEQFAARAGVSRSLISLVEIGTVVPSRDLIDRVVEHFDISFDKLVFEDMTTQEGNK